MFFEKTVGLIEWRTSPKINQEENFVVRIELSNGCLKVCLEIIRTFVRHESYCFNFVLLTENHLTRLLNAFSKFAVASKNDSDHCVAS